MKRTHVHRRIGLSLVAALSMVAMLVLPGFAAAKATHPHHRGVHHQGNHHGLLLRTDRPRPSQVEGSGEAAPDVVEPADDEEAVDDNPAVQENAGLIMSFDGTTLTIELASGGTISGQVTESTEIECEGQAEEVPGSEEGGEDQEGQDGSCTTADLLPGANVSEAELEVTPEGAFFDSIHLGD